MRGSLVVALLVLAALSACHSGFAAGDPILGPIQAVAETGCYAHCQHGQRCDEKTGFCEPEIVDAGCRPDSPTCR
ncbi:MAG: hypothetical protein QM765_40925 [Myxococcales bacterium]